MDHSHQHLLAIGGSMVTFSRSSITKWCPTGTAHRGPRPVEAPLRAAVLEPVEVETLRAAIENMNCSRQTGSGPLGGAEAGLPGG